MKSIIVGMAMLIGASAMAADTGVAVQAGTGPAAAPAVMKKASKPHAKKHKKHCKKCHKSEKKAEEKAPAAK